MALRSDNLIKIWGADAFLNAEGTRTHVIVRENGHYFGKCLAFDPPNMAPVGMDNKVRTITMGKLFILVPFLLSRERCKLD